MKCKTYGILKSFSNLRVLYCTQNLFKYFKLGQNAPRIFRVQKASGIMILFLFYWLGVTPKYGPKVKKSMKVKKNNTKTGITQVLIELQQKIFHQKLALS